MNSILRLLCLFIFAAPGFSASPAADTRTIQAEISRLEDARIAAILKADVKALERLYHDDLVYVHSAGRIDTKPGYLASLAAGNLTYVSLRYDPAPTFSVAGKDMAIASGRATIETKNKAGQVTKRVLTTLTVYVRSGSTWQVISYQGTPVQP